MTTPTQPTELPKPHHTFKVPNGETVSALVLNQAQYDQLLTHIETNPIEDMHPSQLKKYVEVCRQRKYVTGMRRGKDTEALFTKYNIPTTLFTACLEGFAQFQKITSSAKEADKVLRDEYDKLTPELKLEVDDTVNKILDRLREKSIAEDILRPFWMKHLAGIDRGFKFHFGDQAHGSLQDMWAMRNMEFALPIDADFTDFVQRVLVSIISVGDAMRKGEVEAKRKAT